MGRRGHRDRAAVGVARQPSGALLGYLAIVDVLVFALAARAGWSGLDLAALALTALTWRSAYPQGDWGWGTTAALALLFTGLGLAPLPRLTRLEGSVRPIDLAVVAGAPVALILSVWAWCTRMPSQSVAMLWFALAGLHLAAALWVDTRRSERDLWRPLTGAAIVFFTVGVQRLVGSENLALTWCIEGVLLVVLGLAPRSGWLRFCGHAITWLAGFVVLTDPAWWSDAIGGPALLHLGALRELGVIIVLFVGAHLLARRRDQLVPLERWVPEAWTLAGSVLLLVWSWRRCHELAYVTELPAGSWWQGSWPPATEPAVRQARWFSVLLGVAWTAQAAVFAWLGARSGRVLQRVCAYGAGLFAFGALLVALLSSDVWSHGQWPVLHPEGLGVLAGLLLAVVMVARLASRRHQLTRLEHHAPEACATALLLLTLLWTAREADHVTRMVMETGAGSPGNPGSDRRMLAAALTSAAWLLEALAMLAVSFAYQRRAKVRRTGG